MWKTIQTKANTGRPVQLILDMKVRWSSTYLMLDRAERKKEVCITIFSKDYDSPFVSRSASTLLSMNFAGKSKTLRSVIKSVSSSSQVGSGRVSAHFLDCSVYVTVSSTYQSLTVVTSMRTMPNKPFRPRIPQRFTSQSQLLRPFTGHGLVDPSARNLAAQNPSV